MAQVQAVPAAFNLDGFLEDYSQQGQTAIPAPTNSGIPSASLEDNVDSLFAMINALSEQIQSVVPGAAPACGLSLAANTGSIADAGRWHTTPCQLHHASLGRFQFPATLQ